MSVADGGESGLRRIPILNLQLLRGCPNWPAVDLNYSQIGAWSIPAFTLADVAISWGAILLIWAMVLVPWAQCQGGMAREIEWFGVAGP